MKHARTLGLVALAITALTAFAGVSSASAAQFKANGSPVMLFGQDDHQDTFTIDGEPISCLAQFENSSLAMPTNTLTVSAVYSKCGNAFFGWNINMGNCVFEFLQPNAELRGNLAIRCSGAAKMTMKTSIFGGECEVSIGETGNTNLPSIGYSNNNGRISMSIGVSEITANKLKDNPICLLNGTGETKSLSYYGPLVLEGTSGIGISVG
ncbi:MAG TPA: hypothetical protein VFU16_00965 [Solirubrobacterales bacterium]|nr:hypothetical protein [Solirubrobacterales bacterium]